MKHRKNKKPALEKKAPEIEKEAMEKEKETIEKDVTEKEAPENNSSGFIEQINKLCENLFYMSETDAAVLPFAGEKTETVTAGEVLKQTGTAADSPVEEKAFSDFFARLTKIQDWYGDEEKATVQKYADLRDFLEKNLKDLKIFRIGSIQIDIYMVGLDAEGKLMGAQTKAVET